MQPVLGGGDDAGLVLATEGVRRGATRGPETPTRGDPAAAYAPTRPAASRPAAEETASTDRRGADRGEVGEETTAAVSRDSGSESALTASENALTSSGESSS